MVYKLLTAFHAGPASWRFCVLCTFFAPWYLLLLQIWFPDPGCKKTMRTRTVTQNLGTHGRTILLCTCRRDHDDLRNGDAEERRAWGAIGQVWSWYARQVCRAFKSGKRGKIFRCAFLKTFIFPLELCFCQQKYWKGNCWHLKKNLARCHACSACARWLRLVSSRTRGQCRLPPASIAMRAPTTLPKRQGVWGMGYGVCMLYI